MLIDVGIAEAKPGKAAESTRMESEKSSTCEPPESFLEGTWILDQSPGERRVCSRSELALAMLVLVISD